jgi:hypothetical protein
MRVVGFLALVFTAVALVPSGAHLFALPNKIGMTEAQYYIAQSIYSGWAMFGFFLIPALAINVVFAFMLRGDGRAFSCAAAACLCVAATLAIFFAFTYPANVATANWVKAPPDWASLREQWEYSHAVNAGLMFLALCLVSLASVVRRT